MKKFFKLLTVIAICVSAGIGSDLYGQSKKETRQYNKAIKNGTIDDYNAFLKKYPESVYRSKLIHLIDSIYYSQVDMYDVKSMLGFVNLYPASEYIDTVKTRAFQIVLSQRYIQDDKLSKMTMIDGFNEYEYAGNGYYFYIYENRSPLGGVECEYVVNMLDKSTGAVHSSMFKGRVIKSDNECGYIIEGDYMDKGGNGLYLTTEMQHLLDVLEGKDFLVPISEGDVMTDQAIEWWYKNNRQRARVLKFGTLPQSSSMVEKFLNTSDKELKGGYSAVLMDIRGNTVVVVHQKSSNQYILVWAEPVCKDKKNDPYLNTIYFENNNSLVLYYYKGRTTYKVRINMAQKTISR